MKTKKRARKGRLGKALAGTVLICALIAAGVWALTVHGPYGYAREVSPEEASLRDGIVSTAQTWLGCAEADGTHRPIIDLYNGHTPLAQGYLVQYTDSWCSTFASAVAIQCGLTDIIPTECGCQRHIALFEAMGCWVENDGYTPLPGDFIFYSGSDNGLGDCTEWSDHVGIVVGTLGPFMKVIEGNYGDAVGYRILLIDAPGIRGFATPDYAGKPE